MLIGTFKAADGAFTGCLHTLTLSADITIIPAGAADAENAPDWRVFAGSAEAGIEIGAAWDRSGERAGAYLALQIDDPCFAVPLRANLVRDAAGSDSHILLWSRPQPREQI